MKKAIMVLFVAILIGGIVLAAGNGMKNNGGNGVRQQQQIQEF